jgi:shikimate kinase
MQIEIKLKPEKIFLTGYMGSDLSTLGNRLADFLGYELLVLDDLIVARDGRPLQKLIMLMGEHEYRNKEFEILEEYSRRTDFVMVCSDGVVLDQMCLALLKRNPTLFHEEPLDLMWSRAKNDNSLHYAFMHGNEEKEIYKKFNDFYEIRLPLYKECNTITLEQIFEK